jgi:hypothetical protein
MFMTRSITHFPRRLAFTLVELMISIALVLLLVIGINQVFSLTSKTVGAGQASSAAQRDMRAAAKVMQDDFSSALTSKGPCFIIYSRRVWAFRNKADQQTDRDKDVTTQDVQNIGTEQSLPPALYNNRSHRVDLIKFFARGEYHRQTGDPGTIISNTSGNEAWITYGHGQLPDNFQLATNTYDSFHYEDPGSTTFNNPNNLYSSQWILTRQAMVLQGGTPSDICYYKRNASGAAIPDLTPVSAWEAQTTVGTNQYIRANTTSTPANVTVGLNTFRESTQFNGTPNTGGNNTPSQAFSYPVQSGRFDLGNTTIDQIGADFAARIRYFVGNAQPIWYRYYTNVSGTQPQSVNDLLYRLQCNPFLQRPLTAQGVALTTPQFVAGCSQFMVEFAGDFVTQGNDPAAANYGQVLSNQPDGILDFVVPQTPTTYPNYTNGARFPNEGVRQIRWYGYPRDIDGDGMIYGFVAGRTNNQMPDVVPVRDVMLTAPGATVATVASAATFEKESTPTTLTGGPNQDITKGNIILGIPQMTGNVGDYAGFSNTASPTYGDAFGSNSMPNDSSYLCLWEFGGPQMIRIVMTVDDPNGRLNDGATFEYVFTLKK